MPWPRDFHPAGVALHVIQRSHAGTACFFDERDRLAFLHWLRGYTRRFECCVHAYVLMGNHIHLLLTQPSPYGIANLMRALCARYARYVLDAHARDGALWQQGFDASAVHVRRHLLGCMRYIELNPVRAHLVKRPDDYRWSSYRANALGREDALVSPHPFYLGLGRCAESRRAAYVRSFTDTRNRSTPRQSP